MAAGETIVQTDVINFYHGQAKGIKAVAIAVITTSLLWAVVAASFFMATTGNVKKESLHDLVVKECFEQIQASQITFAQ